MSKLKIWERLLTWLFEEENNEEQKPESEETIEINVWQIALIIIVSIVFLFWMCYGHFSQSFFNTEIGFIDGCMAKIEQDYFVKRNGIINGNFSQGLKHWTSSDGGKIFPESKSKVLLESKDYRSAPYSMRIESIHPANRYFYTKKEPAEIINDPYTLNEFGETSHWLGITPDSVVSTSLWYKGDILTFYLNCLSKNGVKSGIGSASGPATRDWKKLEIKAKVPKDARAIAIEITLNQAEGMPSPSVLIDDVVITKEQ